MSYAQTAPPESGSYAYVLTDIRAGFTSSVARKIPVFDGTLVSRRIDWGDGKLTHTMFVETRGQWLRLRQEGWRCKTCDWAMKTGIPVPAAAEAVLRTTEFWREGTPSAADLVATDSQAVLAALRQSGGALLRKEIMAASGMEKDAMEAALGDLMDSGQVVREGQGFGTRFAVAA